ASLMAELLGKQTRMTVQQAADDMRVAANNVYVIPPNASMTIKAGVLQVLKPHDAESRRMPINQFFFSLAEDQGDNAVCIVLSGTGTDGTLGLRSIKEHGGLTIAQAPESAKYDSMPGSAIPTGLVDYVLPIEEMPERLIEYAKALSGLRTRRSDGALDQE